MYFEWLRSHFKIGNDKKKCTTRLQCEGPRRDERRQSGRAAGGNNMDANPLAVEDESGGDSDGGDDGGRSAETELD